ncbi:MAG: VapE domain-containing protein [Micropepsaceae bacterium]
MSRTDPPIDDGQSFQEPDGSTAEGVDAVSGDVDEAIRFLRWLSPVGLWVLTTICPVSRKLEGRSFASNETTEMRQWIEQRNGKANLYFHVNEVRAGIRGPKASAMDVTRVTHLHVDIDPKTGENLASEQARILALLTEGLPSDVPKPSAMIKSGGGYQAFWKLQEPIIVDDNPGNAEAATGYNKWLAGRLGGDKCHNLDRIMRLPGTINLPDAKKRKKGRVPVLARLVDCNDDLHPISDFQRAEQNTSSGGKKKNYDSYSSGARVDLDALKLPDRLKKIILHGRLVDEPKQGDNSRSAWLFDALCNLIRHKVPDDLILGIIMDPTNAVSESVLDKSGGSQRYAERQIAKAHDAVVAESETFATDKRSNILPNSQQNIRVALRRQGIRLSHDTFQDRLLIEGLDGAGPLLDDAVIDRIWLIVDERFKFRATYDFFVRVVCDLARRSPFHPVRRYLDCLSWDGVPRLDNWLSHYAGAEPTSFNKSVGAIVLIAAVRRVRSPGCKFDEMLVLESKQGTDKSGALKILAVDESWFSDDVPFNADSKRTIESLSGKWLLEAAELSGLGNSDVEHVKAFLSRSRDRARMSYHRLVTEAARQSILIGTSNKSEYLRDASGNRRFWPVRVVKFDLEALKRDRDQLWAEAALREEQGESIRLDKSLYGDATLEQEERIVEDPYVVTVRTGLGDITGKIQMEEVWKMFSLSPGQRTQLQNTRLGQAMRQEGWERIKLRFGNKGPEWCFARGSKAERENRILVHRTGIDEPWCATHKSEEF